MPSFGWAFWYNEMSLYLDNGYINMSYVLDKGCPFNFVINGRGTGKTYGALKLCTVDRPERFLYMRRTQVQLELISSEAMSPLKPVAYDCGIDLTYRNISKYSKGIYKADQDGSPIGYMAALSTFSNLRGFDMSDVSLWIMDEFIPERHERPLKNEGAAFLNAYETINRNRELQGHPPLKVLLLGNSNTLVSPILLELGLVDVVSSMRENDIDEYVDTQRGVAVFVLHDSPISQKKAETALYRVASDKYKNMALENTFKGDDFCRTGKRPLNEYKPFVKIGIICIYKHKSKTEFYATTQKAGKFILEYGDSTEEISRAMKKCGESLFQAYMLKNIVFSAHSSEILFKSFII